MTPRLASSGKFIFDAFSISFLLVFIGDGTSSPLAFLWLGACFGISAAAFLAFWKLPYRSGISAAIALCGFLAAFLLGMPLWLAAALCALAIFMLHARFSEYDSSTGQDGNTLLVWVLLFASALVFDILTPPRGASREIYAIILAAFSFYVLFHLLYRFLLSRSGGTKLWQAAASGVTVLSISAAVAFAVYLLGPGARNFAGAAAGWLLHGILWPFAPLMDKVADYFSGLSQSQEAKETFSELQPPEVPEEMQQTAAASSYAGLPFELFFAAGMVVAAVLLILYIRRTKPEKQTAATASPVEEMRGISSKTQEHTDAGAKVQYSEMQLELVRQSYRKFEQEAEAAGLGRKPHETVREWISRMGWPTTEAFFQTYEGVRYGAGTVSKQEALPFLEEIKIIKEKYFQEEV